MPLNDMQTDESLQSLKRASVEKPLNRRDFMRVLTAVSAAGPGLAAAGLSGFALTRTQRAEAAEVVVDGLGKLPKVQYGTRMGKMMVTRMCICQDWNHDLFAPALEMGMNFIHKAGYWNSVPDEIKALPRESYYTDITVDNTSPGNNPDNYDQAYHQVVDTLSRNGLKYYDIFRAHYGWRGTDSFNKGDNASYKAFKRLKSEGKVKYFGVSQHPYSKTVDGSGGVSYPERIDHYAEMISAEIDSGIIDSMQVWMAYGTPQDVIDVFARASKAGIAMTAMKVFQNGHDKMKGDAAKMTELKAPDMVGRSCMRYVMGLKRPDGKSIFHTAVSALGNLTVFDENVGAISPKVASIDGYNPAFA